jgi:hypothetical protein
MRIDFLAVEPFEKIAMRVSDDGAAGVYSSRRNRTLLRPSWPINSRLKASFRRQFAEAGEMLPRAN